MPRALRRCSKCNNPRPCPDHPQGWDRTKALNAHPLPRNWNSLRRAAWNRDGGKCRHCGKFLGHKVNPAGHTDHIIPRSAGGLDVLSNLQTLCVACHTIKTFADRRKYGDSKPARKAKLPRSRR